jgi:hypothetical protein
VIPTTLCCTSVTRSSRTTVSAAKVRVPVIPRHSRDLTNVYPVRVKCSSEDTVGDLKKLIAAQTGTDYRKIQLKKWCVCRPLYLELVINSEQVYHLQGPHHLGRLRDQRRHEPGDVLRWTLRLCMRSCPDPFMETLPPSLCFPNVSCTQCFVLVKCRYISSGVSVDRKHSPARCEMNGVRHPRLSLHSCYYTTCRNMLSISIVRSHSSMPDQIS